MARPSKLERFADMEKYEHVFEPDKVALRTEDSSIKGQWNETFFKSNKPITLELGCGRGEYTVGLAERYPDRNFLGMDIKGARMWKGATYALNQGLKNVGFVRGRIEFVSRIFAKGEIEEIWITFPDPQPKKAKKRLIHPSFLNNYQKFLSKNGVIHLKTDSQLLHAYLLAILNENDIEPEVVTSDLYKKQEDSEAAALKTKYEGDFLAEGKPITYVRFRINPEKILTEPRFDDTKWV